MNSWPRRVAIATVTPLPVWPCLAFNQQALLHLAINVVCFYKAPATSRR